MRTAAACAIASHGHMYMHSSCRPGRQQPRPVTNVRMNICAGVRYWHVRVYVRARMIINILCICLPLRSTSGILVLGYLFILWWHFPHNDSRTAHHLMDLVHATQLTKRRYRWILIIWWIYPQILKHSDYACLFMYFFVFDFLYRASVQLLVVQRST